MALFAQATQCELLVRVAVVTVSHVGMRWTAGTEGDAVPFLALPAGA